MVFFFKRGMSIYVHRYKYYTVPMNTAMVVSVFYRPLDFSAMIEVLLQGWHPRHQPTHMFYPKIGLRHWGKVFAAERAYERISIYSTFHAQWRDVALDRFKVESSKACTWAITRCPQPMLRSYWCSTDLPSLMQWGNCCLRVAISGTKHPTKFLR